MKKKAEIEDIISLSIEEKKKLYENLEKCEIKIDEDTFQPYKEFNNVIYYLEAIMDYEILGEENK